MIKSRLSIGSTGVLVQCSFFAIAGLACIATLPATGFPPHVGVIGIMSLIAAYGIFKHRTWALWVLSALLFIVTTFTGYMLVFASGKDWLLDTSMIAYLILSWIMTVYTLAERKPFES